nr:immunoglobulin light chain junction region [Macaca mulatta]MOW10689.1 immunoglobulin light chain junction region [Macaca mulatta]
CGQATSVPWTF